MSENRVMLQVFVNLDATPGEFHTQESARAAVENMLKMAIPHYKPVVMSEIGPEEARQALDELEDIAEAYVRQLVGFEAIDAYNQVETLVSIITAALVKP